MRRKPGRRLACRSVKVTKHSTIPYVWYSFQLCNSNFVFKKSEKTRMMGLSDGRKSLPIGLAILIQYRSVTATQPPSHVAVAITLNAKASSLKTLRRPGTPLEELTTLPQTPYLVGMGWLPLPKNHTPRSRPFGHRLSYPLQNNFRRR